jgi:hypothetical protein
VRPGVVGLEGYGLAGGRFRVKETALALEGATKIDVRFEEVGLED